MAGVDAAALQGSHVGVLLGAALSRKPGVNVIKLFSFVSDDEA